MINEGITKISYALISDSGGKCHGKYFLKKRDISVKYKCNDMFISIGIEDHYHTSGLLLLEFLVEKTFTN